MPYNVTCLLLSLHTCLLVLLVLQYECCLFPWSSLLVCLVWGADIMRQFEHPHIIRLVGVVADEPTLIVMEYAALGEVSLQDNNYVIHCTLQL